MSDVPVITTAELLGRYFRELREQGLPEDAAVSLVEQAAKYHFEECGNLLAVKA